MDIGGVRALPDDGNRYEVVDGEVLVTPAPSPLHQHVLATLLVALPQYVEQHGLGYVLPDVDLLFATGQFLRPDLVFVPAELRDGITDRGVEKAPGLIVEVQSPTSASIDRVKKPRRYGEIRCAGSTGWRIRWRGWRGAGNSLRVPRSPSG